MAAEGSAKSFELRLLGTVEAARGDARVSLGGPRQRSLLALLAIQPGCPLAAERLVEELWHGMPPAGAATTLRSYLSRLRAALGDDAVIQADSGTYVLEVEPERVDARRFELLAGEGHEALARGAVGRAAERLRASLELWGEPFAGLADGGALGLEAARLEEVRLHALEARIEAELALGAPMTSVRSGNSVEHTQLLPGLTLRHVRTERRPNGSVALIFRVSDAGDPVAGARVAVGSASDLTGGNGLATVVLAARRPGTLRATASRAGYVEDTIGVRCC